MSHDLRKQSFPLSSERSFSGSCLQKQLGSPSLHSCSSVLVTPHSAADAKQLPPQAIMTPTLKHHPSSSDPSIWCSPLIERSSERRSSFLSASLPLCGDELKRNPSDVRPSGSLLKPAHPHEWVPLSKRQSTAGMGEKTIGTLPHPPQCASLFVSPFHAKSLSTSNDEVGEDVVRDPLFSSLSIEVEAPSLGSMNEQQHTGNNTSTCLLKKKKAKLGKPAFDISLVHKASEFGEDDDDEVQCAGKCFPISSVNPFIFLGSWRDAQNIDLLRRYNIRYVLNVAEEVRSDISHTWAELRVGSHKDLSGLQYRREGKLSEEAECHTLSSWAVERKTVPMCDCHSENLASHFDEAFEFMNKAAHEYENALVQRGRFKVEGENPSEVRRISIQRHIDGNYGKILVHCRRGISRSAAIVTAYLMATEGMSFSAAFNRVSERRSCVCLNLAFQEKLSEYLPSSVWLRPVLREVHHFWNPASGSSQSCSEGAEFSERTITSRCALSPSFLDGPKSLESQEEEEHHSHMSHVHRWKENLDEEPHGSPLNETLLSSDWS